MKDIYRLLKEYYGYDSFRPGQENIINAIIKGQDCLAVMPTGAGKSLCYQIPALFLPGTALVISPLVSLMHDQVMKLKEKGIPGAYINSTLTPRQTELALKRASEGRYKIVYAAPERLSSPDFLSFALKAELSLIAVDEAHCISQWGQDFRPDYLRIGEFISKLPKRPAAAAFTATATDKVREDIINYLSLRSPFEAATGFDRPNLYFALKSPADRIAAVCDCISRRSGESGIVYCNRRAEADRLAGILKSENIPAASYHAGLPDDERRRVQDGFIRGDIKVITATSAFGMGIDKPDVRFVIHFGMPRCLEDYYQQAGRAGRDNAAAYCLLLYDPADYYIHKTLISHMHEDDELTDSERRMKVEAAQLRLDQMNYYASSKTTCLRRRLVGYFGETTPYQCGNCSVCTGKDDPISSIRSGLDDTDRELCEKLRSYIRSAARLAGVPVYSVAGDEEMQRIAAEKPSDTESLRKIRGLSEMTIRRFGDGILSIVNEHVKIQNV